MQYLASVADFVAARKMDVVFDERAPIGAGGGFVGVGGGVCEIVVAVVAAAFVVVVV